MRQIISELPVESQIMLRGNGPDADITITGDMRLGREADCEIRIDDKRISRYHCRIQLTHGSLLVEDLRSTNGTFVNGRRIEAPTTVNVGDQLRIHRRAYRVVSHRSAGLDATMLGVSLASNSGLETTIPPTAAKLLALTTPTPPAGERPLPAPAQRDRPGAIQKAVANYRSRHQQYLATLTQLPPGSWIERHDSRRCRWVPFKLIGTASAQDKLHLSNRWGSRIVVKLHEELANELMQGKLRLTDASPVAGDLMIGLSAKVRRTRAASAAAR